MIRCNWYKKCESKKKYFAFFCAIIFFVCYSYHELRQPDPPDNLAAIYKNQQNNFRENSNVYSIGNGIYFSTKNGTFMIVNGKPQRSSFNQYVAQESNNWIVYAAVEKNADYFNVTILSKMTKESLTALSKIGKSALVGDTFYYLGESISSAQRSSFNSANILYAYSILTGDNMVLQESVSDFAVLDNDWLIYTMYNQRSGPGHQTLYYMNLQNGESKEIGVLRDTAVSVGMISPRVENGKCFMQEKEEDWYVSCYEINAHGEIDRNIVYDRSYLSFFNIYNGELYFSRLHGENRIEIFKYNLSTNEETTIASFTTRSRNIRYVQQSVSILNEDTIIISLEDHYWLILDGVCTKLK